MLFGCLNLFKNAILPILMYQIDLCLLKPCNNYKGLCLLVDANCRYLWCAKIKSKQKPDVEKALDEILKKSGHFESREIIHAKSRITLQWTYPCFFFRNCKWWWIEIFEKLFFEEEYLVSCITENSACFICWSKYIHFNYQRSLIQSSVFLTKMPKWKKSRILVLYVLQFLKSQEKLKISKPMLCLSILENLSQWTF